MLANKWAKEKKIIKQVQLYSYEIIDFFVLRNFYMVGMYYFDEMSINKFATILFDLFTWISYILFSFPINVGNCTLLLLRKITANAHIQPFLQLD